MRKNKNQWTVITSAGAMTQRSTIAAEGPHYAGVLAMVKATLEQGASSVAATVHLNDGTSFVVPQLCSPVDAYMAVDYLHTGYLVEEEGPAEVASFLANRAEEGSLMHKLMTEHMPWFESKLPSDLLDAFMLIDDDGSLEHHKTTLRRMASSIALEVEGLLSEGDCTMDTRRQLMNQLQMAAYMELRPRVLLALLLAGIQPEGIVSRVLREHLMAELELY